MPNVFHFPSMDDQKSSSLYIILETPDSGGFEYLQNALKDSSESTFFYLPKSKSAQNGFQKLDNIVFWDDTEVPCFSLNESIPINSTSEFFLYFSPHLDLSDQFELLINELANQTHCEVGRVVSFINANELLKDRSNLQSWLDAVAHFSDVLCITNRSNENGKAVGSLLKRYEDMRYPMESYMISNSKRAKIDSILNPTARRMSHIFDSSDLLETDDKPLTDPYLIKLPNGKRAKAIPASLFAE